MIESDYLATDQERLLNFSAACWYLAMKNSWRKRTPLLLDDRQKLTIPEYEAMFNETIDIDQDQSFEDDLLYSIREIKNTIRYYKEENE